MYHTQCLARRLLVFQGGSAREERSVGLAGAPGSPISTVVLTKR
jgi:hypothetical protein